MYMTGRRDVSYTDRFEIELRPGKVPAVIANKPQLWNDLRMVSAILTDIKLT